MWSKAKNAGCGVVHERRLKRRPFGPTMASICSIAIGRRVASTTARRDRACSIAATSIPAAWRTLPTSSTFRISPSSRGMRAAKADRPASGDSARASARRCATCRRSSITSTAATASRTQDIAVIAQSVGAVLVATWAHDYAPHIRCMVLASPAFRVKLYVPFARAGLEGHAEAARTLLRQFVRQGALPYSRSRAHRVVQRRPADRPAYRRQHPARALRDGRSRGR